MFHVFLNHLASRHWTHQVLQFDICLSSLHFYLHVAEGEEMHKSLRTEVCLVLRRFKVLDYLQAILKNRCFVLLFILEELKEGIGGHFPRRLLGVSCKQLVNLRPLQKPVIECNKLIFIQSLFPNISLFCVCLIELCLQLLFADLDVEQLDQIFCLTEGQRVALVFVRTPELLLQQQVVLGFSAQTLHQDDAVGDRCHPSVSRFLVVSNQVNWWHVTVVVEDN